MQLIFRPKYVILYSLYLSLMGFTSAWISTYVDIMQIKRPDIHYSFTAVWCIWLLCCAASAYDAFTRWFIQSNKDV